MALPAVVLVLALCLGGVQATALQVRLQDAAADAARSTARGDSAALVAERAALAVPGVELLVATEGELVCATLRQGLHLAGVVALDVSARSCALNGGR